MKILKLLTKEQFVLNKLFIGSGIKNYWDSENKNWVLFCGTKVSILNVDCLILAVRRAVFFVKRLFEISYFSRIFFVSLIYDDIINIFNLFEFKFLKNNYFPGLMRKKLIRKRGNKFVRFFKGVSILKNNKQFLWPSIFILLNVNKSFRFCKTELVKLGFPVVALVNVGDSVEDIQFPIFSDNLHRTKVFYLRLFYDVVKDATLNRIDNEAKRICV